MIEEDDHSNLILDTFISPVGEQDFDTFQVFRFHSSEERSVSLSSGHTEEEIKKKHLYISIGFIHEIRMMSQEKLQQSSITEVEKSPHGPDIKETRNSFCCIVGEDICARVSLWT
jgi:hypothetical protein